MEEIKKEKPKIDFVLNDVYDEITERNLQSFEILLDTRDYVPGKFLDRFHNDIFKNYKKQRKRAKQEAEYRRNNPQQEDEEIIPTVEEVKSTVILSDAMQISDTKKEILTWQE